MIIKVFTLVWKCNTNSVTYLLTFWHSHRLFEACYVCLCVDTEKYLCAIYKYIFTHVYVCMIIVYSEGFMQ